MMTVSLEAVGVTQCETGRSAFDPIRPPAALRFSELAAGDEVT